MHCRRETLLVGVGRAFVTGQGIKQLSLEMCEWAGFVKEGSAAQYTEQINQETAFYNRTPIGQSGLAKTAEVGTNILTSCLIPGSAGVRGAKLFFSSAATGAALGGLQPTLDGIYRSRVQNIGIGAAGGILGVALGGYVLPYALPKAKDAFMPLYTASRNRVSNFAAKHVRSTSLYFQNCAGEVASSPLSHLEFVFSPNLRVSSTSGPTTLSQIPQQVVFRKTDDLLGVEPASQELIQAMRNKGRIVEIVKPGTDEYRYMQLQGWEANVGGENLTHILVRKNPSKAALLEEFLHGTQAKVGVLERFSAKHGGDASAAALEAEAHIKQFMIRHKDLLKLHPVDVNILEQLYEIECNRLHTTLKRRFK